MKTKHKNHITLWAVLGVYLLPLTCAHAQFGEHQVHLKTKIAEVSLNDLNELGVQWSTIDAASVFLDRSRFRTFGPFPRGPILNDRFPSLDGTVNGGRSIVIPDGGSIAIDTRVDGILDTLIKARNPVGGIFDSPGFPLLAQPILTGTDVDFDHDEMAVHLPVSRPPGVFTDTPVQLQVTPTVTDDGGIQLDISVDGNFFLKNEKTVEFFAGAGFGDEDGLGQAQANNFANNQFNLFPNNGGNLFAKDATILGVRRSCFHGYHIGLGTTLQYLDGDGEGAWSGEVNGILRYPIETPKLGFGPYAIGGLGGLFADETVSMASLGGGIEIRTDSRYGFFVEGKYNWTEDDLLNHSSVTTGIRIVTDGIGPRKLKTRVLVEDGQTAVLGGLFQGPDRERKLPILHDLPLLSAGFRKRNVQGSERALLILLKPTFHLADEP